jgi:hypothetical protein
MPAMLVGRADKVIDECRLLDPKRPLCLFAIRGSLVSKKARSAETERANLEVTRSSLSALPAFVSIPVSWAFPGQPMAPGLCR